MENDRRDPSPQPLSLIRAPDAAGLLAAALPVIGMRAWPATVAALGRQGLPDAVIDHVDPVVGPTNADTDDMTCHGFAQPGGPMRLTVGVANRLTASLCARRFGGAPAAAGGRRRAGSVERSIARQVAEAIRVDTGCDGWAAIDDDDVGQGTGAIRTLSFALDGAASPLIRLVLTGASATPAPRVTSPADWLEQLRQLGGEVRLPLRSVLARPVLSAGEVARLAVGDVIPIRAPDRVALLSGRHRLAVGILDECDGHAAVRLDPQAEVQ